MPTVNKIILAVFIAAAVVVFAYAVISRWNARQRESARRENARKNAVKGGEF